MQKQLLAQIDGEFATWFEAARAFVVSGGIRLLVNAATALAIFVIGRVVVRLVTNLVGSIVTRTGVDETLVGFLRNILYVAGMVFVVLASLDKLGVNTTSMAAILAAAGLAVGMALQSSLSNFASGVMLILFKPFKVGDFVEAGGSTGVVEEIQIFNTIMRTGDNVQIIVPNGSVTAATITNYSANDTRRIDLVAGCGYGDNLQDVKTFLEELLAADERVLDEPESVVAVHELGDSSVNFVVRPWVAAEDYWATRWDLTEAIKVGFEDRGFSIPYPTQDLHLHQASA